MPARLERLLPWALRVAWALLPLTVGPSVGDALAGRTRPVQLVASVALWAVWAGVVTATLVAHPAGLTALRVAAPGALAAALAAALAGGGGASGGASGARALAVAWSAVTAMVAFLPETGAWFVNGPAYPNERRFLLRVPGPLLLGILPLAWVLAVGLPAGAALLVATGRAVAGVVVGALAVPAVWVLVGAMHNLSRRWVVFVPAGVVLHDPLALADPVLFPRELVEVLRPAPAGSDSLDLTQRAPGLALELMLAEKVPMVLMRPGTRGGEPGSSARLLFTPTRPGAVLAEAAARGLPVG